MIEMTFQLLATIFVLAGFTGLVVLPVLVLAYMPGIRLSQRGRFVKVVLIGLVMAPVGLLFQMFYQEPWAQPAAQWCGTATMISGLIWWYRRPHRRYRTRPVRTTRTRY